MGSYIIKAKNPSGEEGTVVPDVGFRYTDNFNDVNEGDIKISGTGSVKRSLLVIGSEIEIKRNEKVEFLGIIDNLSYFEGGTVVFHVTGFEFWLIKEKGVYANSPWVATDSADIFSDIIGESTKFAAGTIEAGVNIDFRLNTAQSLYNGLANLAKKTTQDIQIDYVNKEVDILNHRGSSTSVGTFNENINIGNVGVNEAYPLGNHILVFGKGDGENQIKGEAEDASSISTYGRIKMPVYDSSVSSTAEANKLADAILPINKDPPKIIDFDFYNPNENVSTGDIITLNASELSQEEVRIVGLERGMRGDKEFLNAQVTNPAFKQLIRIKDKLMAEIKKDQMDQGSYMQGSGNTLTFSNSLNAKSGAPLRINFFLSSSQVSDEIGNLRINTITVDYDVDPYRSEFLTSNTSDNSLTGADMTNVSAVSNAGITNVVKGSSDTGYSLGPYTDTSWFDSSSWQSADVSINIGNDKYSWHAAFVVMRIIHDATNIFATMYFRLKNTNDTEYWPDANGVQIARAVYVSTSISASAFGFIIVPRNWTNKNYVVQVRTNTSGLIRELHFGYYGIEGHTHPNTFNDANHTNNNTFDDVNHDHEVTIGDDVTDAGSLNASNTTIKLEFWNGSSWVTKVTLNSQPVVPTTDLDLSGGGNYPDVTGYWRVTIEPNNASPDFVLAVVKLKHSLDS